LSISPKLARKILAGLKQRRRVSASLTGSATHPGAAVRITKVSIRLKR
jgi:hypothetical protein